MRDVRDAHRIVDAKDTLEFRSQQFEDQVEALLEKVRVPELTHSLTHSLTQPLTHSLSHPLPQSNL